MHDVITFGSATRDIFLKSAAFETHKSGHSPTGVETCFPLAAKIELDDITLETGGGGTNAAVTFARLGLRTAAVTAVGDDPSGRDVMRALDDDCVAADFVQISKEEHTAHSVIVLTGSGERTVLVYRGASGKIEADRIPWRRMRSDWFYVSSLGGNLPLLRMIMARAERAGALVAWNPGSKELNSGLKTLAPLIRKAAIFNLNREEAAHLLREKPAAFASIIKKLRPLPRRALVVTDGRAGAYAADATGLWRSGIINVPRVNVTGAGDAFGSGFVAGLMKKDDIRHALAVGTWNATGVVQQMGAKRGIIRKYPSAAEVKMVTVKKII